MGKEKIAEIASWYSEKEIATSKQAAAQLRNVFLLVVFGLVAILSLDLIIERINSTVFNVNSPNETLKLSQIALNTLSEANSDLGDSNDKLSAEIEEMRADLKKLNGESVAPRENIRDQFMADFPLWRTGRYAEDWRPALNQSIELSHITSLPSGLALAVGTASDNVIVLTSKDYEAWSVAFQYEGSERSKIEEISFQPDGSIVLIGSSGYQSKPLVIRSPNGVGFEAQELDVAETAGKLIGAASIPGGNGESLLVFSDGSFWAANLAASEVRPLKWATPAFSLSGASSIKSVDMKSFSDNIHIFVVFKVSEFEEEARIFSSKNGLVWESKPVVPYEEAADEVLGWDGGIYGGLYLNVSGLSLVGGFEAMDTNFPFRFVYNSGLSKWDRRSFDGMPRTGCGYSTPLDYDRMSDGRIVMTTTWCWTNFGIVSGASLEELSLSVVPSKFFGSFKALQTTRDGRLILVGPGLPIVSLSNAERENFASRAFLGSISAVPADLLLPTDLRHSIEENGRVSSEIERLSFEIESLTVQLNNSVFLFAKQKDALATLEDTRAELRKSYEQTQDTRQIVALATRVSFIALLMYLTQIIVRRYRYLQRLTVFYEGRYQALSLYDAEGGSNSSLSEITEALSGDKVSFDPLSGEEVSSIVKNPLGRS